MHSMGVISFQPFRRRWRAGSRVKDWSSDPTKGYKVLVGEGNANWKEILTAAETVGGAEYLLIEQEGSRFSEMETARRCLQTYHAVARS